jgi:hypothetical protein
MCNTSEPCLCYKQIPLSTINFLFRFESILWNCYEHSFIRDQGGRLQLPCYSCILYKHPQILFIFKLFVPPPPMTYWCNYQQDTVDSIKFELQGSLNLFKFEEVHQYRRKVRCDLTTVGTILVVHQCQKFCNSDSEFLAVYIDICTRYMGTTAIVTYPCPADRNFPCQTLKIRKVSLVVMGS